MCEWSDMVERTAAISGSEKEQTERILDSFMDCLRDEMRDNESIPLRRDIGRFEARARGGGNGDSAGNIAKEQRIVVFKMSNDLKKDLRQTDAEFEGKLRKEGRYRQLGRQLAAGAK